MKRSSGPGRFAATVGISAVVTAGFGWIEVLLGWTLAAVLRYLLPERKSGRYNIICMWVLLALGAFLIGGVVLAAEKAFPEDGTFPFVTVGLLLLLYRTLIGEKNTGDMVANVLGLVLAGLMGVILLFGFSKVDFCEMVPTGFSWQQVWITAAVTAPWWKEKDNWGWFSAGAVFSVAMSQLCRGVLGAALTEYSELPLYRAVQTITIMGTLQRFEALFAAAVLMGTYAMLVQVGNVVREMGEDILGNISNRKWTAIFLLVSFFVEKLYIMADSGLKSTISTVFWGAIPIFTLGVVFCKKDKKVLDKTESLE